MSQDALKKVAKILLDIEIGDEVLVGRFKNKRVKVETIGTDENGQPTINGRKLLALRIKKLMPDGGAKAATAAAAAKGLKKKAISSSAKQKLITTLIGAGLGGATGYAIAEEEGILPGGFIGGGLGYAVGDPIVSKLKQLWNRRKQEEKKGLTLSGRISEKERKLLEAARRRKEEGDEDYPKIVSSPTAPVDYEGVPAGPPDEQGMVNIGASPAAQELVDKAQRPVVGTKGEVTPRQAIQEQYHTYEDFKRNLRNAIDYRLKTGRKYKQRLDAEALDTPIPYEVSSTRPDIGFYKQPGFQYNLESGRVTQFEGGGAGEGRITLGTNPLVRSLLIMAHEPRHATQRMRVGDKLIVPEEDSSGNLTAKGGYSQESGRMDNPLQPELAKREHEYLDLVDPYDEDTGDHMDMNYAVVDTAEREERLGALRALASSLGYDVSDRGVARDFLDKFTKGEIRMGPAEWSLRGADAEKFIELRRRMEEDNNEADFSKILNMMAEEMPGVVRNSVRDSVLKAISKFTGIGGTGTA